MSPPPNSVRIFDGSPYVPSRQATRNVGLTADYVTHMCRDGSVDGRLIERRWYVSEDSLRAFLNRVSRRKARWHRSLSALRKNDYDRAADLRPAPSPACPCCGRPLPTDRSHARHV